MAKRTSKIYAMSARSIGTTNPPKPNLDDKSLIISCFDGNTFYEELLNAYEKSPTHRACINIQIKLAQGDGIIVKRKDGKPYEYDTRLEAWLRINRINDLYNRQVTDTVIFAQNVLRVNGEYVEHTDASTFRYATPKESHELEKGYLSHYWNDKELRRVNKDTLTKYAIELPLYDGGNDDSLLVTKEYSPGREYYALPNYYSVAGMRWADIEYKIPTYNLSNIDNRFMPSGLFTLIGQPPDGMTQKEYLDLFLSNFTGEGNNSKLVAQVVSNPEQKPDFTEITTQPDGIFTELQNLAQQNILVMHRMHPSILMAIPGKLGGTQGKEVHMHIEQYMSMVIRPYVKLCMKPLNRILKDNGFEQYELDVVNNNPVSLISDVTIDEILTPNEIREELGFSKVDEKETLYSSLGQEAFDAVLKIITAAISEMNVERKKGMLSTFFGFNDEQIKQLLNDNGRPDINIQPE